VLLSLHFILNLKITEWITYCLVCINAGLVWTFQKKSSAPSQIEKKQVEWCKLIIQELTSKGLVGPQVEKNPSLKEIEQENQLPLTP
jgi:hypothetical protein